jgi:hypothetical protein
MWAILTGANSVKAKEWRRIFGPGGLHDLAAADVSACPAIRLVEVEIPTGAAAICIPQRTI